MPHTLSAKKRLRQNVKRRMRNRVRKARLFSTIKQFRAALETGDKAAIDEQLKNVYSMLDKAASKGVLHKANADRRKQRLTIEANKAVAAPAT